MTWLRAGRYLHAETTALDGCGGGVVRDRGKRLRAAFSTSRRTQRSRQICHAGFNDGGFTHCKIMYTSVRSEANGMGWATDYPYAGINLLTRVKELTKTPVSVDAAGEPNYWVVRLTDDALFSCPFTMATDVGTAQFSPEEARRLRDYLLKGGFLWVDDFWGTEAWLQWSSEMRKVLPEYPIVDVPPDHPIRRTMFNIPAIPQVTSINFWRRSGGAHQSGAPTAHLPTSG